MSTKKVLESILHENTCWFYVSSCDLKKENYMSSIFVRKVNEVKIVAHPAKAIHR